MNCPFLTETKVRFCQCASVRKLIPSTQGIASEEKCASSAHASCAIFREQAEIGIARLEIESQTELSHEFNPFTQLRFNLFIVWQPAL